MHITILLQFVVYGCAGLVGAQVEGEVAAHFCAEGFVVVVGVEFVQFLCAGMSVVD